MANDPNIVDEQQDQKIGFDEFRKEVLADYKLACVSREASLIGRKEVLTGKAKFGIFGDGKEVPQLAMAKAFRKVISARAITGTRHSCLPRVWATWSTSSHSSMPIRT